MKLQSASFCLLRLTAVKNAVKSTVESTDRRMVNDFSLSLNICQAL